MTSERDSRHIRLSNLARSFNKKGPKASLFLDPHFKPLILKELVVVPFEDGIVVDGASRFHVFRCKAGRRVLPALMQLMNGSRTIQELVGAIPDARREDLQNAISLMSSCGLLEDGRIALSGNKEAPRNETLSFFRRCLRSNPARAESGEPYERLSRANIVIIKSDSGTPYSEILSSLLVKTGIRRVICLERQSLAEWDPPGLAQGSQSLLVSVGSGTEDSDWHAELDDWCAIRRLTWLRSSLDWSHNLADLGPLFDRKVNPCYRCFLSVHRSLEGGEQPRMNASNANLYFWCGILASEIAHIISSAGPLITGTEFQRYNLPLWTARSLRWPRIPRCPHCHPFARSEAEHTDVLSMPTCIETAMVFEDYVGLQSLALVAQKESIDAKVYRALALPTDQMHHCTQLGLARDIPKLEQSILNPLVEDAVSSGESVTVDELSVLLQLTAGIRRVSSAGIPLRWTATAGNLGSVALFVVARCVEGLSPGIYRYQSDEHSLAHFQRHTGALSAGEFMRRTMSHETDLLPDVLLIFVGAYGRVAQKYSEFAYRLINLDSGVAVSQFNMLARAFNLVYHVASRWADDLIEEQLNLDSERESCTAVIALGRSGSHPVRENAAPMGDSCMEAKSKTLSKSLREFYGKSVHQVMEMLQHEGRLEEPEVHFLPLTVPSELRKRNSDEHHYPLTVLPTPAHGGRLLGDILRYRKSVRQYPPEPISLKQLSTMLKYAHESDRNHWPAEQAENLPLTFLALAFRVEGLDHAVYTYDSTKHGLHRSAIALSHGEVAKLFVQREFADAPLVVWIAGNLAAAVARHGPFGYRQLLLRAGVAAHRLWMAGMATGLSGCIVAGVVPGAARQQLGLDGYIKSSLLAIAAGGSSLM